MRHANFSYRRLVARVRRRKAMRRTALVLGLTLALAWFLPSLVTGWLNLGDQVVVSMHPYRPYDFEREAWLAGQLAGKENESMTKVEFDKYFRKEVSDRALLKTKKTFLIYDFAFDAGYKKTSDYNKRFTKKRE